MKKALGKGLSALIPDNYINKKEKDKVKHSEAGMEALEGKYHPFQIIPISHVVPNKDQPRKEFSPEGIDELAASIREKGVLQPILVKKLSEDQYMLICGERRFRAASLCGLTSIPAIVQDVADRDLLEWALIENIQRQDLNPIEEAGAYSRLAEGQGLSQDEIAKRVGKDRSTVANMMRLLRLPVEIQAYLASGRLTAGHARALLGMLTPQHQRQMAKRIVEDNLSVRQVEAIVTRSNAQKRRAKKARNLSPEIADLERRLEQHLGTHVKIIPRKNQKQGRIEIQYFSLDDLDRVLDKFQIPQA